MSAFADNSGLFERGHSSNHSYEGMGNSREGIYYTPILPYHELNTNQPADILPLSGGIAILLSLGAAYWVGKKRKDE